MTDLTGQSFITNNHFSEIKKTNKTRTSVDSSTAQTRMICLKDNIPLPDLASYCRLWHSVSQRCSPSSQPRTADLEFINVCLFFKTSLFFFCTFSALPSLFPLIVLQSTCIHKERKFLLKVSEWQFHNGGAAIWYVYTIYTQ